MVRFQHLEVYHDTYRFVLALYKIKLKLPQTFKHDLTPPIVGGRL